jgi:hypothetical protein
VEDPGEVSLDVPAALALGAVVLRQRREDAFESPAGVGLGPELLHRI